MSPLRAPFSFDIVDHVQLDCRHPPGWSYADVARRSLSSTPSSRSVSSPVVGYSVPPSPNPEQGEQHVWSINKCRGGQGASMVVLGQAEAEREKVRKMGTKREWPRTRGRSMSVRWVAAILFSFFLVLFC